METKILTKRCIVIYDENEIIVKSLNNAETIVGKGRKCAEFDTAAELENFILENNLLEYVAE